MSADGLWLTATTATAATDVRVSFPTPAGTLTSGTDAQTFPLWLRKTTGATNPITDVQLWKAGAHVKTLAYGTSITSTTGQTVSVPWTASYTPVTTFSEDWTGSNGAAWNATRWPTIDVTSTSTATIQSNAGQLVAQGAAYAYARALSASGTFADQEATGILTLAGTGEQYHGITVRHSGGWGSNPVYPVTGLRALAWNDGSSGYLALESFVSNTRTVLAQISKTWGTSAWSFRIRASGSWIGARFWQGGEPGTWDVEGAIAGVTSGIVSLTALNGNATTARTATWDTLSVADIGVAFATTDGAAVECRVVSYPGPA